MPQSDTFSLDAAGSGSDGGEEMHGEQVVVCCPTAVNRKKNCEPDGQNNSNQGLGGYGLGCFWSTYPGLWPTRKHSAKVSASSRCPSLSMISSESIPSGQDLVQMGGWS